MDENNTNGFGNTDDEYEDEGTTVLTTPGVSAFAKCARGWTEWRCK